MASSSTPTPPPPPQHSLKCHREETFVTFCVVLCVCVCNVYHSLRGRQAGRHHRLCRRCRHVCRVDWLKNGHWLRWLAETNEREEAADWTTKATGHLMDGWPSKEERTAGADCTWLGPARHPHYCRLLLHRCPQVGQQKECACVWGTRQCQLLFTTGTLCRLTPNLPRFLMLQIWKMPSYFAALSCRATV